MKKRNPTDVASEEIIISKGIKPGNEVKREMTSKSRLGLFSRSGPLKTDRKGRLYRGDCSLDEMGVNSEPPIPTLVDEHKVAFGTYPPEEILKNRQEKQAEHVITPQ